MRSIEPALPRLVAEQLADAATGWAIGTFGAIAEFHRAPGEPVQIDDTSARTARGGIRLALDPAVRAVAWERPTAGDAWTHGIALCLPEAAGAMSARTGLAELGEDREALEPGERDEVLFDLGIGAPHCELCVRTRDPELKRELRSAVRRPELAPSVFAALAAASPTRVLVSRLGRVEVKTPIPPPGGRTPEGPHTHLLPQLLKHRRTHSANVPIPEGWVPCAELFPPRDGRFAALFAAHADPDHVRAKEATIAAVRAGERPRDDPGYTRAQRQARRVALRQLLQSDGPSATLSAWRRAYDLES